MVNDARRAFERDMAPARYERRKDYQGTQIGNGVDPASIARIVRRVRAGDRDSFGLVYLLFRTKVERFMRKLMPASTDVEQLTQDVFTKALLEIARLRDTSRFNGWLMAIARNEALGTLRQRRRTSEYAMGSLEELGGTCYLDVEAYSRLAQVEEISKRLPYLKRRLLACMVLGLTEKEIGMRLGLSVAAVKLRKHRLRRFLTEALA